jgi:hypothetical protein
LEIEKMLNLAKKPKPHTVDELKKIIDRLEVKLIDMHHASDDASRKLNVLLLAETSATIDDAKALTKNVKDRHKHPEPDELSRAKQDYALAKQNVADIKGALEAAQQSLLDAQAREKLEAEQFVGKALKKLSAQRLTVAKQIEQQTADLAASIRQLQDLSEQIGQTLPEEIDSTAAMAGPRDTFNTVQENLWLHGVVTGAPFSKWELERRPSLVEKLETAKTYLENMINV